MECLNCTNELVNLPKKRAKIFCSNTCRTHYWQKAKKLEDAGKSVEEIVKTIKKEKKPQNKTAAAPEIPKTTNTATEKKELPVEPKKELSATERRIKEIEAELKSPPNNPIIGIKMWTATRVKEIEKLKSPL